MRISIKNEDLNTTCFRISNRVADDHHPEEARLFKRYNRHTSCQNSSGIEISLSLCRRVPASRPDAGIVIMTARVALNDRIAGYKQGRADFYLTKPVSPDELVFVSCRSVALAPTCSLRRSPQCRG